MKRNLRSSISRAQRRLRLALAFVLPLLLVLMQQGALRHEIAHHGPSSTTSPTRAPDVDRCDLCLGFAQVAATAIAAVPQGFLLSGLSFHHADSTVPVGVAAPLPTPRSRGPPLV